MEIVMERPYKIVRTMPDGLRLLIGSFADESEARKKVAAFNEYWPGDYKIVQPHVEHRVNRVRIG
jgi:hypothetical protein